MGHSIGGRRPDFLLNALHDNYEKTSWTWSSCPKNSNWVHSDENSLYLVGQWSLGEVFFVVVGVGFFWFCGFLGSCFVLVLVGVFLVAGDSSTLKIDTE